MAQFSATGGKVVAITPNDSTDLPGGRCFGICCGTAGTLNFIDAAGNDVTNFPLQAGYNPISVKRVKTGGTADDLWALYEVY